MVAGALYTNLYKNLIECVVIFLLVILAFWLLAGWQKLQSFELLSPYAKGQTLSDSWLLEGIGNPDGDAKRLVVQLRNPNYKNPAYIFLDAKTNNCKKSCSKNFLLSLDFKLRDKNKSKADLTSEGYPQSLQKSFELILKQVIANDTYESAKEVLTGDWDYLDVYKKPSVFQRYLSPEIEANKLFAYLILLFALGWLSFLLVSQNLFFAEILAVFLLFLVALLFRLPGLNEAFTSDAALQRMIYSLFDLKDIVFLQTPEKNHLPMIFLLLKSSLAVFGQSEFAARFMFFLAGLFSVPIFYLLIRKLFSPIVAISAMLLLAISPIHRELSLMVNDFVLLGFFGLLLSLSFLKLQKNHNSKQKSLFLIAAFLTIHSSFLGLFWVLGLFVYDLMNQKVFKKYWLFVAIFTLPIVFAASIAIKEAVQIKASGFNPEIAWHSQDKGQFLLKLFLSYFNMPFSLGLLVAILLGIILLLKQPYLRNKYKVLLFPFVSLILPVTGLLFLSRVRVDYYYLFVLFLLPIPALFITRMMMKNTHGKFFRASRILSALLLSLVAASCIGISTDVENSWHMENSQTILNVRQYLDEQQNRTSQTVAMLSDLGLFGNYYLCDSLDMWQDRHGSGFKTCKKNREFFSLGSARSVFKLSDKELDKNILLNLGKNEHGKFYLLLAKYSPQNLNKWADTNCTVLLQEQKLALFECAL